MRCALYLKNNMTRSRQSNKAKPISVTRVSSATTSDNVSVVLETNPRQSTRQREMTHKPARTEVVKNGGQRASGGRHLQPPTGNNAKLKHECPFEGCPWRFATPYKLRRHIKSHTKETPYQCKECGRGFSVRYNLLMHIQTIHSTPHKYKCPVAGCKEAFHTQPRLNGHLRKIHKKDWKQLQMEQEKSCPTKKTTDNDSIASSPSSSDSSSLKDTPIEPSNSKWQKCTDCGKEFSSQAKFSAHMKTHSTSYPCTFQGCSKTFPTSDKLSKHLDSFHKSFPCPNKDCNRVFLKQSQLKNHIRIHSNAKYCCPKPDCGSKFDNEVDYSDHLHIHMGVSIPCPYKECNLSFPTQKRLELHYRVAHQNTTPSSNTGVNLPPFLQSKSKEGTDDHVTISGGDNFMEGLELPDLKVEDVEAVISEHTSWTGDQIETFLKSLDLEELDCRGSLKSSLSGYESDSGYSTHEVSPMGGCSAHYSSALSPAITPVTPSPILSTSSSTSSPVPFCLYQDDLFPSANPYMTPATPNSATPSGDHHFFSGTDLPLFPQTSPNALTEHVFNPPTLCHSNASHHVPTCSSFHSAPSSQPFISLSQPPKSCVQSVLPPISNVSDIETNRHSVTIVPNSYCASRCSSDLSTSVAMSQATTSQCSEASFAQFDKFLDGYFLGSEDSQLPTTTSPSCNTRTIKTESDCIISKDVVERLQAKLRKPSIEEENSNMHVAKNSLPKEIKEAKTDVDSSSSSLPDGLSLFIDGRSLSPETSRMVIAQVLSSPKKGQSMVAGFPSPQTMNHGSRPCKGKGKGRQQQPATVSMKGAQRGKRKSNWPKSMNSGNLMAFRNFILGKLKQSKPVSHSFAGPSERLISCEMPSSISAPPTCSTSFFSNPSDDIFSDITFNPDTLLSSERSMSPFSHHSRSISPSPVPLSPSLESNMHFTSLSSLSSDTGACTANLGIDGFIQCLSVDPILQSTGGSDQLCHVQLPGEFSSILKTDADPLLGGIS